MKVLIPFAVVDKATHAQISSVWVIAIAHKMILFLLIPDCRPVMVDFIPFITSTNPHRKWLKLQDTFYVPVSLIG